MKFQDDSLYRCSISAGSQTDNSESEDTTDNENHDLEDNGYPDAEHEVYPETHDDHDHIFSRKLSESIGSEASELYDYKVPYLNSFCSPTPLSTPLLMHRDIVRIKNKKFVFPICTRQYNANLEDLFLGNDIKFTFQGYVKIFCGVLKSVVLI